LFCQIGAAAARAPIGFVLPKSPSWRDRLCSAEIAITARVSRIGFVVPKFMRGRKSA
jgi:hypothetical protein